MKIPLAAALLVAADVCLSQAAAAPILTLEQVPGPVRQEFHARFPTVKRTEWKIKPDKNYEAEFTLKGTEIAVKFDPMGKWLETESAISRFKVPQTVRDAASGKFQGYKVIERQSVQRWNETRLIYELHLENATEIVKAEFDPDGTILKQSAKTRLGK